MRKTTLYLPDSLKLRIEQLAREERRSEADVMRAALASYADSRPPPRPVLPLFASGRPDLAERFDELLEGFGED